jgi:predicted DCC family thiol-disulfide oxidoreductase YuxK
MPSAVLLYDSDCGFCRWSLGKVLAWDRRGRIRPISLQSKEAEELLAGMSEEERLGSWHLVGPDGRLHSAGAGIPPLLSLLPGGSLFAAAAARMPRTMEWGYRWVAEHRSLWGRLVTDGAKRRADRRIAARLKRA